MEETLALSPEDLYCLGLLMKAEYIDYAYIAAANGMGGSLRLFKKETSAALVQRGVLQEDFSGELTVEPSAQQLLRPIFFGGREMTLDLCRLTGEQSVDAYKFHFHGEAAVMVRCREEDLAIAHIDRQGALKAVDSLLPQGTRGEKSALSPEDAVCIIVLKHVSLNGSAERAAFAMDARGGFYREAGEDRMEAAEREDVLAAAEKMLEGV